MVLQNCNCHWLLRQILHCTARNSEVAITRAEDKVKRVQTEVGGENLRFGTFAAVHAHNDDVCVVGLGHHPERLLRCLVLFNLFLDEARLACLVHSQNLPHVLLFDVLGLVLEGQVVFRRMRDRAHVKLVLACAP